MASPLSVLKKVIPLNCVYVEGWETMTRTVERYGEAITQMARELFGKYRFLRHIVNVNRPWQMQIIRNAMYKRYVPYAKLVEEKVAQGEWGNTWRVRVNPNNTDEGIAFDLVGCPWRIMPGQTDT